MRSLAALLVAMAVHSAALGQPAAPAAPNLANFYLQPQPDRVQEYLKGIDAADLADAKRSLGLVTGFMTEVLRANPGRVEGWLAGGPYSRNTQAALVSALWLAGTPDAARGAAKRFAWPERELKGFFDPLARAKDLDAINPNTGNELDMFWGAFFASGEARHVNRILYAYNSRARNAGIAPLDIQLLATAVGTRKPSPADAEQMERMKARYSPASRYAVAIAATALWALGSNSRQHDRVREIVTGYLKGAHNDAATTVLARQLALLSTPVGAQSGVLILTTRDPDFIRGAKDIVERKIEPKVDKVFKKQDRAFIGLIAVTKPHQELEYSAELTGVRGGAARSRGRIVGEASHAILASMIPLTPQPAEARGLYDIVVTVSGPETGKYSYRTMVFFDED
jgi:hypothetical protein